MKNSSKLDKAIEKLTEETSTHMLNMKLAPELTKDLVVNAEKRAKQEIKDLMHRFNVKPDHSRFINQGDYERQLERWRNIKKEIEDL